MTKISVSKNYYGFDIKAVEKKYTAKYIGDFCIKQKNGEWTDTPVSVFYVENPDLEKGHSNYFGLFLKYEKLKSKAYICDASSAFSEPFTGIVADDGEVVISCYRHDFRRSKDKSVSIDGGRNYNRYLFKENPKLVNIGIKKNKLYVLL